MIETINFLRIFMLILSLVFISKYIILFTVKLFQDEPKPLKLNNKEEILILFAITFILTNITCFITQ